MVNERRAFGDRLRRERERSGVSLESLSQATKVAVSLYTGLERGECSRWPAGIYGRSYVKAYAEAVGLNAQDTVEEFSALFGAASADTAGVSGVAPAKRPLRLTMVEEPAIRPEVIATRAALAGADLVIGFLIASLVIVGFGGGVWTTVSSLLAYYVGGRLVGDDPLLYWAYLKMRNAPAPTPEPPSENVPVGDAASTTA
jgi:transcriptional regulator with XRE-family HTH domain